MKTTYGYNWRPRRFFANVWKTVIEEALKCGLRRDKCEQIATRVINASEEGAAVPGWLRRSLNRRCSATAAGFMEENMDCLFGPFGPEGTKWKCEIIFYYEFLL